MFTTAAQLVHPELDLVRKQSNVLLTLPSIKQTCSRRRNTRHYFASQNNGFIGYWRWTASRPRGQNVGRDLLRLFISANPLSLAKWVWKCKEGKEKVMQVQSSCFMNTWKWKQYRIFQTIISHYFFTPCGLTWGAALHFVQKRDGIYVQRRNR